MSESKMKPRYILLTSPTLKFSRSTHSNSFNARSFEGPSQFAVQSSQQKVKQYTQPSLHNQSQQSAMPAERVRYGKDQRNQSPSQPTFKHLPSCHQKTLCGKDSALVRNLQQVRVQLTQCMQMTVSELKRNNVLKQLNALLVGETKLMEEREKDVKKRGEREGKRVQKEEYELEQIQQKYNEEVARITALREMVDSARTDRVVYSALFKKIEWEIKHYENLYRETVLRNELSRVAKQQRQRRQIATSMVSDSGQELQAREQTGSKCESKSPKEDRALSELFVTGLEREDRLTTKRDLRRKGERRRQQLVDLIAEMEGQIERVAKAVECGSAEEAIERYVSLESENVQLIQRIQEDEFMIQEIELEIERLNLQRRNSEVAEERHLTRLESLPSTRKLRSYRQIKTVSPQKDEHPAGLVLELAALAGVKGKGRSLEVVLAEVERRVWDEEGVVDERDLQSLQGVQTLLNRMQKYQSCERLLSKQQFEGEYMREVSRQCRQQRVRK